MKLCPTCGQNISRFGNKVVKCALCTSEFCTGCEEAFRGKKRGAYDFPLCRKCQLELEPDEVLGLELTCPNCSKEYFVKEYHELKCRCRLPLHTISGKVVKIMVLSCPVCEEEIDPFDERLLSCSLCGDLFCTHCQRTFRSKERGEGLFPLCGECFSSLGTHETVMLTIACENCCDVFKFFDPSKISTLHGEEVRLSDPFPVRCKCGKFHDIDEGTVRRVKLYADANNQVKYIVLDREPDEEKLEGEDVHDEDDELVEGEGNEELVEGEDKSIGDRWGDLENEELIEDEDDELNDEDLVEDDAEGEDDTLMEKEERFTVKEVECSDEGPESTSKRPERSAVGADHSPLVRRRRTKYEREHLFRQVREGKRSGMNYQAPRQ